MDMFKKKKLPPGVKSFRIKLVLAFLAVVLALAYFPFNGVQTSTAVSNKTSPVAVEEVKSVSVTHEANVAAAMLEEMKVTTISEPAIRNAVMLTHCWALHTFDHLTDTSTK